MQLAKDTGSRISVLRWQEISKIKSCAMQEVERLKYSRRIK